MTISIKYTLCGLSMAASLATACATEEDLGPVESATAELEASTHAESIPARLQPPGHARLRADAASASTFGSLLSAEVGDDGTIRRAAPRFVEAAPPSEVPPPEARVPDTLAGDIDCEPRAAPSLCAWAGSADAVALFEVTAVRAERADAVALDPAAEKYVSTRSCRTVRAALRIEATVVKPLMGKLPSSVTVAVGAEQRGLFQPLPVAAEDGLRWLPSERADTGPLRVGAYVVMAVHRVASGYSLMGDLIAGVDADNRVHRPRRAGDCFGGAPEGLTGPVDGLRATLSACDVASQDTLQLRAERRARWGSPEDPGLYRAAYCVDATPGFEDRVGSDEDFDAPTSSTD